jgi:CTP synthase
MAIKIGPENCLFVHVVYLPYLGASAEFKTKPAQNAVRELRGLGIVPDVLVARSEVMPPKAVIPKLSLFSGVEKDAIVLLPNAQTVYQVPLTLEASHIDEIIIGKLGIKAQKANMSEWNRVVKAATTKYRNNLRIGVIAKYIDNADTYMSLFEAVKSAAWANEVNVDIVWVNAENLEKNKKDREVLLSLDGIIGMPGFGSRGIEGKIFAADFAYDNQIPYLGVCLGLQVAIIAMARKAGLKNANSTEINPKTPYPVVSTMAEQIGKENTGGTMRLGDYTAVLESGSKARKLYGQQKIVDRHRHRYEANNDFRDMYEQWGLKISGLSPDGKLVEMIEAPAHPFFVATQAHPEFRSRPNRPHPLFSGLIQAAKKRK